jgi:putative transposase
MQWLKGISSRILWMEFPHLQKQFWGKHLSARGYKKMIQQYIQEQEGEPII